MKSMPLIFSITLFNLKIKSDFNPLEFCLDSNTFLNLESNREKNHSFSVRKTMRHKFENISICNKYRKNDNAKVNKIL